MQKTHILNSYTVITSRDGIKISNSKGVIVSILISISTLIFFMLNLMPALVLLFAIFATWSFYFIRIHININTNAQKIWKAISIFGKPISIPFYLNLDSVKITAIESISAGTDTSGGNIAYVVYAIRKSNKEKLFLIQLDDKKEVFLFESILKETGYYNFEIVWRKS